MPEDKKDSTPHFANWLISRCIDESLLEEFLGDLQEIHKERIDSKGNRYAKLMYWVDVLHLLTGFISLQLFKDFQNPTVMYRHYVIVAFRDLFRNKMYSLINIGGLAVGMGASLIICQYIYFELSYDNFHKNVHNTYRITLTNIEGEKQNDPTIHTQHRLGTIGLDHIPEIKQFVRLHPLFGRSLIISNPEINQPFNEESLFFVDSNFLDVFDFPLREGTPETALAEKNNIVITETISKKYFGDVNPIGKELKLEGAWAEGNFVVAGVLEDLPFNSHLQFDFLLPMQFLLAHKVYKNTDGWSFNNFVTYVTIQEDTNIKGIGRKYDNLIAQYRTNIPPDTEIKCGFQAVSDIHLRSSFEGDPAANNGNIRDVYAFAIIAVFLLIIAGVNYISMSTARSIYRAKEVGIRKSIGAIRKQLISQFMLESFMFIFLSAILAIGLAWLMLPTLNNILGKELVMDLLKLPAFWIVFFLTIVFYAIISGLYPALNLSGFGPISMLRSYNMSQVGGFNIRQGLIIFQFILSFLLIAGTYLVYDQITFMQRQDMGVDMERVVVVMGPRADIDWENLEANFKTFKNELISHHSISIVSNSGSVPGKGFNWRHGGIHRLGEPSDQGSAGNMVFVDVDFAKIYDYEFLAGETFTQDMLHDKRHAIINEEAIRTFGLESPEKAINQKLVIWKDTVRVIGVLKNFHWHSLKGEHEPYLFRHSSSRANYFSLKIDLSNIPETIRHAQSTFEAVFPGNPFVYFFLDDEFNRQYQSDLEFGNLFSAFTVLAIFIACIGLFALVSFSTASRIKEIGIRKVLGASVTNLMILLSREYLILLSISILIAIPAVIYLGSAWLDNYAFRTDIGFELLMIPALALVVISILTVSLKTYYSAKGNPVNSLRKE